MTKTPLEAIDILSRHVKEQAETTAALIKGVLNDIPPPAAAPAPVPMHLRELKDQLEERELEAKLLRAALDMVAPKPPAAFRDMLGPYETLILDKGCNEPIGWGFKILRKLEDSEAAALKTHGDIDYLADGSYGLVVRWLTEAEAVEKYGAKGNLEWGPRGGFKGVTYGDKQFNHRKMKPKSITV